MAELLFCLIMRGSDIRGGGVKGQVGRSRSNCTGNDLPALCGVINIF